MNSIIDILQSENEYYDSQKIPGFVQGTVVENNNPDHKGMVKVEFTVWESGSNLCEWVRLMTPYAGADYGMYCVPEIDETVLVGFIGGSLKRPFLLGSLYPGGAAAVNDSFDEKNLKKHLKTKGGMDILIHDEEGKQKITLTTPAGNLILVDDENQCCKVSDKEGKNLMELDYKGGNINVTADKKIVLKAGKTELGMDGSSGTISVKGEKLSLTAGNEIGMKANASLKMEGAQVELKGSAQVNMQSSGPLAVKGAVVQIN